MQRLQAPHYGVTVGVPEGRARYAQFCTAAVTFLVAASKPVTNNISIVL
jgi:hypothetical protein